jgi:hypothetical protein
MSSTEARRLAIPPELEAETLAMEPDSGGVLLAELTPKGKDAFAFKMVGAGDSDPAIDFAR